MMFSFEISTVSSLGAIASCNRGDSVTSYDLLAFYSMVNWFFP